MAAADPNGDIVPAPPPPLPALGGGNPMAPGEVPEVVVEPGNPVSLRMRVRAMFWDGVERLKKEFITALLRSIVLLFRVLLHGFGAFFRILWNDPSVRGFLYLALLISLLFTPSVRGFWSGTSIKSYDLTDEDFALCPPGNRLKKDTWSKLSLTGPHCEPVTPQDNVTFGEDLQTILARLAVSGISQAPGASRFKGWFSWLTTFLESHGYGDMQAKVLTQLKDVTKDMRHTVKDAEQEIRGTINQELGGVKSTTTRTEDKVERVKMKIEDVKDQLEKDMKQMKGDFTAQFVELKDLILAASTDSVEAKEFAQLQADKKRLEREGDDCSKMLHTSEKMLRDCQERAKRHEDWTPDDAIRSVMDYAGEVYREYFTLAGIWRKMRTYSRVWVATKFLAQSAFWISSLSWWGFFWWVFVVGNMLVVILSVLLSVFRIADNAMSVTERLWNLCKAIFKAIFSVFYFIFYLGWMAVECVLMLVVMTFQPRDPNPEPPRRRVPPMQRARALRREPEGLPMAVVDVEEEPRLTALQRILIAYQRTNPVRPMEVMWQGLPGQEYPGHVPPAGEAIAQPPEPIAQVEEVREPAVVEPAAAPVEERAEPAGEPAAVPAESERSPVVAPAVVAERREPYVLVAARPVRREGNNGRSPQSQGVPRRRTPEPRIHRARTPEQRSPRVRSERRSDHGGSRESTRNSRQAMNLRETPPQRQHGRNDRRRDRQERSASPRGHRSGRSSPESAMGSRGARSEGGRSESQRRWDSEQLRRAIDEDLRAPVNQRPPSRVYPECPHCTMTSHSAMDCPLGWWRDTTPPRRPIERDPNEPGPSNLRAPPSEPEIHVIEPSDEFSFWTDKGGSSRPRLFHVKGFIDKIPQKISFLIDTGSACSILPRKTLEKHGTQFKRDGRGTRLVGFAGKTENASGTITRAVQIGTQTKDLLFFVSENAVRPILGLDALRQFRLVLNTVEGTLSTTTGEVVYCHAVDMPDVEPEVVGEASTSQASKNE